MNRANGRACGPARAAVFPSKICRYSAATASARSAVIGSGSYLPISRGFASLPCFAAVPPFWHESPAKILDTEFEVGGNARGLRPGDFRFFNEDVDKLAERRPFALDGYFPVAPLPSASRELRLSPFHHQF